MLLPKFCYSKIFLILMPIIIGLAVTTTTGIYAQIDTLEQRVIDNSILLAENNVPELKETITNNYEKQDQKIDRLQISVNENYRLLCKLSAGEC